MEEEIKEAIVWAWRNKVFMLHGSSDEIIVHYYRESKKKEKYLKVKMDDRENWLDEE